MRRHSPCRTGFRSWFPNPSGAGPIPYPALFSFGPETPIFPGRQQPERFVMALIGPGGTPVTSSPAQNAASAGIASPYIKDSGLATFAADVLEASREVPVIVDFWAPWCGPCKTLGPALEKAVHAANGAVRLVKVNIDENPEIAQQLRIQSIPTVFAFKAGQPVDGFMGAIPESQIKTFVATL